MRTLSLMLLSATAIVAPLSAQTTAPAAAQAAAPAAAAAVTAGAKVVDTTGAAVGTIESVASGVATLATGTTKVGVPVGSFAAAPAGGLVIGLTKAQIEAQASQAAQALTITVGAAVMDVKGAKIGTVKAVTGDMITVASAEASAQLPKSSFAQGDGGLVIGMSPEQFNAAAKAAGGSKPSGGAM